MATNSTPPVVRDEPPRDRGPDLSAVGTDLIISEGEAMTYGEYRRERGEEAEEREREAALTR